MRGVGVREASSQATVAGIGRGGWWGLRLGFGDGWGRKDNNDWR